MDRTEAVMPSTPTQATRIDYDVLVCSYNGERYIAEQLESIIKQNPPPKHILVSDDGSTDGTRDIVKQLAQTSPVPITLIDGPRQGVIKNVLTSLPKTNAEYVFLSDQDDIWLDNKVPLFSEHMTQTDAPHLIFSDAWVWHPGNESMASFWELDGLRPDNAKNPKKLAFHNTVQGASACFNRALINAAQDAGYLDDVVMHDWWLALIASSLGKVNSISQPTLLYRQHDSNQVGSQNKAGRKRKGLSYRRAVATRILRQAAAFTDHYETQLTPELRRFFRAYRWALRGNVFKRAWFILRYWPTHRDLRHTITLWASIGLATGTRL